MDMDSLGIIPVGTSLYALGNVLVGLPYLQTTVYKITVNHSHNYYFFKLFEKKIHD